MFMNQYDIELMANNTHACPNVRKAVNLLNQLMLAVNRQSDGWAYWSAPSKSAEKLMQLLTEKAGNLWHNTRGTITDAELKAAVTPIKRMVTTQTKKQKQYGNTFEFDVDAALKMAMGD